MKLINLLFVSFLLMQNIHASDIYNFALKDIDGKKLELEKYKGKPLILVNIATRCGYTGQLDDIEKIYKKYQGKGLKILAIPSNDFKNQTPENNKDVKKFCRLEYGVTFDLSKKYHVLGDKKHPLIKHLVGDDEINWNFEKFLISKNGELKKRFKSDVKPTSKEFKKATQDLL